MSGFNFGKLKDPQYFAENRLPAHSDHIFYRDEAELARGVSSFYRTLGGIWHFAYARNTALIPQGFEAADYACHDWETIHVPAHIQMQGHGVPHYTNTTYPWDGHESIAPGEIPTRSNPVGCYVKYFNVPEDWENVFISFGGVDAALALFLNGHFVGYSEDSCTPADFDLTPYLVTGENKLAAMVFRYTSASWLEDQDFWRFSGIYRDVLLYTKPQHHIEDVAVRAVPFERDGYTHGQLDVHLTFGDAAEKHVEILLCDEDGDCIWEDEASIPAKTHTFSGEAACVLLWSAESPWLYHLLIRVRDAADVLQEVVRVRVGFREFCLRDGLMQINGKRIVFKGVNRHEFDSDHGRAMNPALFEQDIIALKRANVNAIRTSHYPNSSRLYELCDIYGFYVIDETNLETHGSWMKNGACAKDAHTVPGDSEEWLPAVFDLAFAADQQARLDYAYAAIGKVTERAKQLIQANYQSAPKHSYYMGCSTGGRESMIAAQRYPNEFDGVVVGNAAFRLSRAMLGATWIYQHLMAAAPKNAQGQKILANALSQKDLDAVVRGVLKRCDAKDGVADGIVNAWESCDFKPEMVQKEIGAKKVALLKAIFGGPKNSRGEALYAGFPFDTALTEASRRAWWLGTDASVPVNTSNNILSIPLLTHYFMQPYSTTRDPLKFDFDRDVASTLNTRGLNDGDSPNLKTFKANGGRMIIFDGVSDPIFSAFDQRDWYRAMHETTGDAQSFARLFIVPGMTHCGGGRSLDDFDPLTALEQWREEGRAPAHLLAKGKAFPGKSQPICAYPTVTTYMGGDLNRAESYACK